MDKIKTFFQKIGYGNLFTYAALTVLVAFVFNISLKEHIFGSDIYIAVTLIIALAVLLIANRKEFIDKIKSFKKADIVFIAVLAVISLWVVIRNGDLANGNFGKPFFFLFALALLFLFLYIEKCQMAMFKLIVVFALEHTFFTWFCFFFPSFYKKYILGLFPTFSTELTWQFEHRQIAGLTMHYSTNALYLAIGLFALVAIMIKSEKRKYFYLPAALTLGALLLTGKRGTLVFAVAAIILVYIICNIKNLKKTLIRVGIALVIAALILLVLSIFIPTITQSFTRFFGQKDITNGRIPMYQLAISEFKDAPLFGIGWGQYKYEYDAHGISGTQRTMDAHNVYLQLLCETGIVGFILFVGLFIYTAYLTLRLIVKKHNTDKLTLFSLAIQLFFLMYALTGNPLYDVQVLYPYVFGISVVFVTKRKELNE